MMRVRLLASTVVVLTIASVAQSQTVHLGSIRNLTNTNNLIVPSDAPNERNFVAVNVFGSTNQTVRGLTFQTDGQAAGLGNVIGGGASPSIQVAANSQIDNWSTFPTITGPDTGNVGVVANNFDQAYYDIRYQGAVDNTALTITLSNLQVGGTYHLQTVSHEAGGITDRSFDIVWDYGGANQLAVDEFHTTPLGALGVIWDYTFTALNSSVVVGFYRGNVAGSNTTANNRDPLLQAIILSQVIPEPASIVGWLVGGVFVIGLTHLQLRRRRK